MKLSVTEHLEPFYFRAGASVTVLRGNGYRLPTEAAWEHACRGGAVTRFWTGDDAAGLLQAEWLSENSGQRTHRVGGLAANPFGLFDVHGNVNEWVEDQWSPTFFQQFADMPAVDPVGPSSEQRLYVVRGGGWHVGPRNYKAWERFAGDPGASDPRVGFRLALPVEGVRAALDRQISPAGPD